MAGKIERAIGTCLAFVCFVYFLQFFVLGHIVGPWDFDHLSSYSQLAWFFWERADSLVPQFNPYFCGGRTLGGDPQVPIYSPLTLLVPILGPIRLLKWEMFAQLCFGIMGLVAWLRHFKLSREQILWGTLLFISCGGVIAKFMVGHVTLGYYFLYPGLLFLSYEIEKRSGLAKGKLILLYWLAFIYCGLYKPNFLIYGVPSLFFEATLRSIFTRKITPLLWLSLGVLWCGGINAVSYLPSREYFTDFPRPDDAPGKFIPPYSFLANLIFPLKAVPDFLYGSVFLQRHEYNLFVGPVTVVLAAIGFKRVKGVEVRALFITALLSIWIGFGAFDEKLHPLLPYTWLRPLWPGFQSIRVPVRFWFFALLPLILYSAAALPSLKKTWQKRVFLFLGLLPLVATATVNLSKTSFLADPKVQAHSQAKIRPGLRPARWVEGSPHTMLGHIRKNEGVLNCADNIQVFQSADLEPGPYFPKKLQWDSWNGIGVRTEEKTLQLNLNHSNYWSFDGLAGKITSRNTERLTLASDSGRIDGWLVYRQPKVRAGILISALSSILFLCLCILYLWKRRISSPRAPRDLPRLETQMSQMTSQMLKLFLLLIAGINLGAGIVREWKNLALYLWEPVPTKISFSVETDPHNTKDAVPHRLNAQFSYTVGSETYVSRIWTRRDELLSYQELHKKGADFLDSQMAYVNPRNPSEAVLERDWKMPVRSLLLCVAFSVLLIAFASPDSARAKIWLRTSAMFIGVVGMLQLSQIVPQTFESSRLAQAKIARSEVRYHGGRPYFHVVFETEGKSYSQFLFKNDLRSLYQLKSEMGVGQLVGAEIGVHSAWVRRPSVLSLLTPTLLWIFLAALLFGSTRALPLYKRILEGVSRTLAHSLSFFASSTYSASLLLIPLLSGGLLTLYLGKICSRFLFDEMSNLGTWSTLLLNSALVAIAIIAVYAFSMSLLLMNVLLGVFLESTISKPESSKTLGLH